MKVLSVVGASHQVIKAAIVSQQLIAKGIDEVILTAGSHLGDTLSQIFLEEMEIPDSKYKLNISDSTPSTIIGNLLIGIESAIVEEHPDIVLVYGSTNSALAGAIAARKLQIPVAHVEAGVRSFNMRTPDELNRIIIDRISNLLFCPTEIAIENLRKEGFDLFPCKIYNTGDVIQDAANHYGVISPMKSDIINRLNIKHSFALATISSQENTDNPNKLKEIVTALNRITRDQSVVVLLQPSTIKQLRSSGVEINFTIIPPVNYFDLVELLRGCSIVLTDSGEVQKEAFFFSKCCVTLKQETEWAELVQNGFNMLGSSDSEFILIAYNEMIRRKPDFNTDLYGKGQASERIAEILKKGIG